MNVGQTIEEINNKKEAAKEQFLKKTNEKKEAAKQVFNVKSKTGLLKEKMSNMVKLPGVDEIKSQVLDEIIKPNVRKNIIKLYEPALKKAKEEALKNAPDIKEIEKKIENIKEIEEILQKCIDTYKEEAQNLQKKFNNYTVGEKEDGTYDNGAGKSSNWYLDNYEKSDTETISLIDKKAEDLTLSDFGITLYNNIDASIKKIEEINAKFTKTYLDGSPYYENSKDENSNSYKYNKRSMIFKENLNSSKEFIENSLGLFKEYVSLLDELNDLDGEEFKSKIEVVKGKKDAIQTGINNIYVGETNGDKYYDYNSAYDAGFLSINYGNLPETITVTDEDTSTTEKLFTFDLAGGIKNFFDCKSSLQVALNKVSKALEEDIKAELLLDKIDDLLGILGEPNDEIKENIEYYNCKSFEIKDEKILDKYYKEDNGEPKEIKIVKDIKDIENFLFDIFIEDDNFINTDETVKITNLYSRYNKSSKDEELAQEEYAEAITLLAEQSEKLKKILDEIEAKVKSFDCTVLKESLSEELDGIFSDIGSLSTSIMTFTGQVSSLSVAVINPLAVSEAPAIIMATLMSGQEIINNIISLLDKCDKIDFDISKFPIVKEIFTILNTVVSIMSTIELMKMPVDKAAKQAMKLIKKIKKLI